MLNSRRVGHAHLKPKATAPARSVPTESVL